MGQWVWVWKPPGFREPIEKPEGIYCFGVLVRGESIIFQLGGPRTESYENVYKTEADANAAFNKHLMSMRLEK